jgi:two-component sensor histidine kinase
VTAIDAEREQAMNRNAILSEELHHRVQNTLAIVLALARITARSVTTLEEFQIAFGKRVQAMARTNTVLLRGHVQAVDVRAALELELEPYRQQGSEIVLTCAPLLIATDAALSLSLLLHELATNAVKYGALGSPDGRLTVDCAAGDPGAVLTWTEHNPSMHAVPSQEGTGTLLIERLARDLGGAAVLDFGEDGLIARISFALDSAASPAG